MKKFFLICAVPILIALNALSFCSSASAAASGDALWAKSTLTAPNGTKFISTAIDKNGNSYGVGYIYGTGTFDFGNGVTVDGVSTYYDALIVKYDSNGNALWAKSMISAPADSHYKSVAVDSNGNVYAAGRIYGTTNYNLGNSVLLSGTSSSYSPIVAKYDSNGNAQWAKSKVSGTTGCLLEGIAIDKNDNIYVAGHITGNAINNFGNNVLVNGPSSHTSGVIVKYNTSGTPQWAKSKISGANYNAFEDVSVDDDGDIYAVGYIQDTTAYGFGNGVYIAGQASGQNAVLLKYNKDGYAKWAKSVTTATDESYLKGVTSDKNGNIYTTGYISGSGAFEFGDGVYVNGTYTGGGNALLVKYNKYGDTEWANSVTEGSNWSIFYSSILDDSNNIFVAGSLRGNGTYSFGNSVTLGNKDTDGYNLALLRYNNAGKAEWVKSITNPPDSSGLFDIDIDGSGNLIVAGYVTGSDLFDLGNGVSVSGGYNSSDNAMLAKYFGNTPQAGSSSSSGVASNSSSSDGSNVVSDGRSLKPKVLLFGSMVLLLIS